MSTVKLILIHLTCAREPDAESDAERTSHFDGLPEHVLFLCQYRSTLMVGFALTSSSHSAMDIGSSKMGAQSTQRES